MYDKERQEGGSDETHSVDSDGDRRLRMISVSGSIYGQGRWNQAMRGRLRLASGGVDWLLFA